MQGVCFITRRCALPMFVPTTLVWLFRDFPQIWFLRLRGDITRRGVLQHVHVSREHVSSRRAEVSWPAVQFCANGEALLSLAPRHERKIHAHGCRSSVAHSVLMSQRKAVS